MAELFLLTGERNSGKSSTLQRWIAEWHRAGLRIGGVLATGVVAEGEKCGFDLVNVASGVVYPVVRRRPFAMSYQHCGYYFDVDGFQRLTDAISDAACPDLLVLDELGPLELGRQRGLFDLFRHFLVNSRVPMLAVVRSMCLFDAVTITSDLLEQAGGGLISHHSAD